MPGNKIISEFSEEELLAIARGAKVEAVIEKISEAAKFIYAMEIREGRTSIPASLVWYTYKRYKGFDSKRQSKRYFFKDFNKYFNPHRKEDGMHYMLDAKSFDTSDETKWIIRADLRYEKSQRRKKTSKKSD